MLALICVGLTTGLGGVDASRFQATVHGTARDQRRPSESGSPPRPAVTLQLIPAQEGNPFRDPVSALLMFAGAPARVPALHTALSSYSMQTSPIGALEPVTGGQGDVLPPASQAFSARATVFGPLSGSALAPHSAYSDSPPFPQGGQGHAMAALAGLSRAALITGARQGGASSLSIALDSAIHSPTLRLERVVDSQTLASNVPVVAVVRPNDPTTDLVAAAQRPPAPAGLELMDTHPNATNYQQYPTATPTDTPVPPTPTDTPVPPTPTDTPVPPTATPAPPTATVPIVDTATPAATATPVPQATATTTTQSSTASGSASSDAVYTAPTATWVPPTDTPSPVPPLPTATAVVAPTAAALPASAQWQWFRITGYTWTGNRTATGTWPVVGRTVAVDPSVIPLHSTVYIQGLGTFVAEDTGGLVIGRHIDVFVASDSAAYAITGERLVTWTPPT